MISNDSDAMPDHQLEAVKIANDWNRQLALWAAGSVVLTVTFLGDVLGGRPVSGCSRLLLGAGWIPMVLSLFLGHFAYGAPLTGAGRGGDWTLKVNDRTRQLSIAQASLFFVGLLFLVFFGLANVQLK